MIGLFTALGVSAGFFLLIMGTEMSPAMLTKKIADKTLSIVLPQPEKSDETSPAELWNYPAVGLSPQVNVLPIDKKQTANRRILRVGHKRNIKTPSEAAKMAKRGDIIEIDAGRYFGDVAIWRAPNMLIRGVGGRATLAAGGNAFGGKAIWVINADNITVENIAFEECKVSDKNGAGIRVQGDNLVVRNCIFRENENGILCGNLKNVKRLTVEYSEFGFNGHGDGRTHGIYIGAIREFTFQFNYVHHTRAGHHVKSRAGLNRIQYNFLTDAEDGNSAYAIDLPDGGKCFVIGNIIQQSRFTENSTLIHYGMPRSQKGGEFFVVNNTAFSNRHTGILLLNHSPSEGLIANNLITGKLNLVVGHARSKGNIQVEKSCFIPKPSFPFAINRHCKAVDAGAELTNATGEKLTPEHEYVHPLGMRRRKIVNLIDVGAFEYGNAFETAGE